MSWRGYDPDRKRFWTDERVDQLAHLRCVEGLSYREIAEILHSTRGAVKTQAEIRGMRLTPQAWAIRRNMREQGQADAQ